MSAIATHPAEYSVGRSDFRYKVEMPDSFEGVDSSPAKWCAFDFDRRGGSPGGWTMRFTIYDPRDAPGKVFEVSREMQARYLERELES